MQSVEASEFMSLKPVKESKKNENAVESADIKTASLDFSPLLSLNME